MTLRILEDGSLVLDERLTRVRLGAMAGALALVAVFAFTATARGHLTRSEISGGLAGVAGLLGLAAAVADRSFRFERTTGRVLWKVRRLFATRSGEALFHDVIRVSLRASVDSDPRPDRVTYQPILVTRAEELPLSSYHATSRAESEVLTRAISEILGRAYEPPRKATLAELIAADRIIEAVRHVRRESDAAGGPRLGLAEAKAVVDELRNTATPDRRAA